MKLNLNIRKLAFKSLAVPGLLLLALGGLSFIGGQKVSAETPPPYTSSTHELTFFAYVKSGESLDYTLKRFVDRTDLPDGQEAIKIDIYSNDGDNNPNNTCIINIGPVADPANPGAANTCSRSVTNSGDDSIFKLTITYVGGSADLEPAYRDNYEWEINVKASNGNNKPGRVWTKNLKINQKSPATADINNYPSLGTETTDIELWYQSEDGYLYRLYQPQYNGLVSGFFANPYGQVYQNTCEPYYGSIEFNTVGAGRPYRLVDNECGGLYKLFLASPANDLPQEATTWDNKTEWIKPDIQTPEIKDVSFDSVSPGSRAGKLNFTVVGYSGTASIEFDTNADGQADFTRTLNVKSGLNTLEYDGKDKDGNPIPDNQDVKLKIKLDKLAEIHFINNDVESRAGGIEINRLNGPTENRNIVYWDDTKLDTNRCTVTPQLDGTNGVDSSGGVHEWGARKSDGNFCDGNYGSTTDYAEAETGTWGNMRFINDWAYVPISISLDYSIPPLLSSDLEVKKELINRKESYKEGEIVTYKITLLNRGPDADTGVEITDTHSENLTYVSHEAPDGTTYNPDTGVWSVPNIDANQTYELQVGFRIGSNPGGFWNQAEVTKSANPDPDSNPANCGTAVEDDCAKAEFNQPGKGVGVPSTGALIGKIIAGATAIALTGYLGRDLYLRNQKKQKSER